jgi:anhydro-N-acetylmuramic acid kinase
LNVLSIVSGTSTDGLTWACVAINEKYGRLSLEILEKGRYPYGSRLKNLLLQITNSGSAKLEDITRAHWLIGRSLKHIAGKLMHDVSFSVFSGHTLYHNEQIGRTGLGTFQIGAVEPLSLSLDRPVISDMRYTDVAAGGMGAPLVPAADSFLFPRGSAVLNIGGIANVTLLGRNTFGFDCGPGNMLIDGAMRRLFGKEMDRGGKIALSGTVSNSLISFLMKDTFVNSSPPKSCGRERYSDSFLDNIIQKARKKGLSDRDIVATVSEFTVRSILVNLKRYGANRKSLIVAGGGAFNRFLMEGLMAGFDGSVVTSDRYGIDPEIREAAAFAILGYQSLKQRNANSRATGARRLTPLGKITITGFSRDLTFGLR